jgi:hypothetical protein
LQTNFGRFRKGTLVRMMNAADWLRKSFVSLEVNESFTEAILLMRDDSRLCFCHRVGERWAKVVDADRARPDLCLADQVLSLISLFRLNARHLDVQFGDGSRWEASFRDLRECRS